MHRCRHLRATADLTRVAARSRTLYIYGRVVLLTLFLSVIICPAMDLLPFADTDTNSMAFSSDRHNDRGCDCRYVDPLGNNTSGGIAVGRISCRVICTVGTECAELHRTLNNARQSV